MTVRGKRKASQLARNSIKRTRLEASATKTGEFNNCVVKKLLTSFIAKYEESEDEDDAYKSANSSDRDHESDDNDDDDISENPRTGADTPTTPFSPTHTKWPSRLKTLQCPFEGCDKTFNRPVRLEAHKRSHTNERPFACEYEGCGKTYMQEKHLKQHIKGSHLHEKKYVCDWEGCGKSFLTGQRLSRHMKVHEGEERFRCTGYPPCNETFRKHQTMQRHIRAAHLHLPEYPCTFVDPETSIACDAAYDAAGSLRKHVDRVHNDPRFTCDECMGKVDEDGEPLQTTFPTKSQLTAHIREQHAHCMFCDLKCSSQQVLRQHIESQHSASTLEDRKNISCTYPGCDKRFVKNSNLKAHIQSVHEGKKFVCGEVDLHDTSGAGSWDGQNACGAPFATKANLVDHVRTQHMGLPSVINAGRIKGTGKTGLNKKKTKQEPSAIDELTGNSYSNLQGRDISCAFPDCPFKFMREYDHHVHLKAKHSLTAEQATQLSTFHEEDMGGGAYESQNVDMMMEQHHISTFGNDISHETRFEADSFDEPNFGEVFAGSSDADLQQRRIAEALENSLDMGQEVQGPTGGDGTFWIGGSLDEVAPDHTWLNDEREMQSLIDRDPRSAERFWDSIDPKLRDA